MFKSQISIFNSEGANEILNRYDIFVKNALTGMRFFYSIVRQLIRHFRRLFRNQGSRVSVGKIPIINYFVRELGAEFRGFLKLMRSKIYKFHRRSSRETFFQQRIGENFVLIVAKLGRKNAFGRDCQFSTYLLELVRNKVVSSNV